MYNSISSDEFYQKEKNEQLPIIDVREISEFQERHILSATNIPLSHLKTHINKLNKQKHYYVICHSGGRSANACAFLNQQGFDVTNVLGGMSSWKGDLTQ